MRARRGATDLAGILPVDKPSGMTSHDVVAAVRRATGEGRVGHAGTLDPMATGLLVVLVGPHTRLEPYLAAARKSYDARIVFGTATDTDDAEGEVTATAPVGPDVADLEHARAVLESLIGPSMQTPPAYSAIKVGGRTAHRAARAGETLDVAPRPVEVYQALLTGVAADPPSWDVSFVVSKGTYVRALARDVGVACGTRAHLGALRRTASGALTLADAHTLDEVASAAAGGDLARLFADPVVALGLPTVEADAADVASGRPIAAAEGVAGERVGVLVGGRLAAVYRSEDGRLVADAVLAGAAA